ncbi:sensor histidine kinase [Clostridiaceae bacterium AM27-36LB]|nr:sensor histidine kinase [Clostridiales bacterium AM23-16LB]RHR45907.1 sensor histidine kinase [Clostridiaceae bacterium AF18-31LB]RHT85422.1 sensor histidine kinase [Clostridiaceae bacterium AM27-36LB]RHW04078.1 sensor histidine kinase [Clostridiaceae bacterium OF09-1]
MAIKWKNNSVKGILLVLVCAMLASTAMCNAYPVFREKAQANITEMKQKQQEDTTTYLLDMDEDLERYLLSSIYYLNYEITPGMDAYAYFTQNYDVEKLSEADQEQLSKAAAKLMKAMRNQYVTEHNMDDYNGFADGVEKSFGQDPTGELQSAIYNPNLTANTYAAGIVISYDSRGIPSVRNAWGIVEDYEELISDLTHASVGKLMDDNGMDEDGSYDSEEEDVAYTEITVEDVTETYEDAIDSSISDYQVTQESNALLRQLPLPMIQNTTFAFGIMNQNGYSDQDWRDYWIDRDAYLRSGIVTGGILITVFMVILALILQNLSSLELRKTRVFCLPTEVTAILWGGGMVMTAVVFDTLAIETLHNGADGLAGVLADNFGLGTASNGAAVFLVWLAWTAYALGWYWMMAVAMPYLAHPICTLKERWLLIRCFRKVKTWCIKLWHWATEVQLGKDLTKTILKLVAVNGLIVTLLCCIWFGGIVGAVMYSILLFILIKNKCGKIQEEYDRLLDATRQIAAGDLNTSMKEEMGLFNPVRDELASIQDGFQKAVQEEVRSRNMKTELITNVSHDLKTPLTAIITYVDLLKKEDLTDEERREYVDTLEKKSNRLKVLIEDLFEVSKATTDNLVMNYAEVDLVNLIKEVRLENEDKITSSSLDFRWNLPEEKCILRLDPQRTFRVIDNLVQNILKYSMPNSRVYIALQDQTTQVTVSFKNMSAVEMNFTPEEITERFARGDLSRNTEGSGLGLAIAQSFTELQGGEFKVETDADLFKVTITWKKQSQTKENTEN